MSAKKNQKFLISGGPANNLIATLERYVYDNPSCTNEALHFSDLNLREIALQSSVISETTALHKILNELAYIDFYLYLYDDIDWCENIFDFANYAAEMFPWMNIATPIEFTLKDKEIVHAAREKYAKMFLGGITQIVNSAFAYLWMRKQLLHDFNLKLSREISPLLKNVHPELASDGKIHRPSYIPKWLRDALLHRDRGSCHYCGTLVASPLVQNQDFQIDHMVPLALGGTNDPTNFVISCGTCNNQKSAKLQSISDAFHWPNRF
ncbi:MAG TPA: hypothetical protein DE312_07185 [Gallionella sp.]|nr:MAG: hypothetical protein A2Z87_13430 [Gallionellales bacterium GWA2_54_124]OGT17283.1 MAG: hypothetical protein A2522_06965 [Gallionellales bacterium RIFOXYD12_FULL_53_10]HCI53082.1 hypothetical protein [Gallionella sp.]